MRKYFFEYCWFKDGKIQEITKNQLIYDFKHYEWDQYLLLYANISIHDNGIIEINAKKPKIIYAYSKQDVNRFLENCGKILSKDDLCDIVEYKRGNYFEIIKIPIYTNLLKVPFKLWFKYLFKGWNKYKEVFKTKKYWAKYFITNIHEHYNVILKDWKDVTPINK